jgi:hypothetical protein
MMFCIFRTYSFHIYYTKACEYYYNVQFNIYYIRLQFEHLVSNYPYKSAIRNSYFSN